MSRRPRAPRTHLSAALVAACLALVACGSAEPTSSENPAFDLTGTAWRATSVVGRAVPADQAPRLGFDWLGRPNGMGFTGCDEFGFEATFDSGRVAVGDLTLNPSGCAGPGSDVEDVFLASFRAAEAWSVQGDLLTLTGPGGQVVLARELPPVGDPGRQLAEALRLGEWHIFTAPGVADLVLLSPVLISDRLLIGGGECGFSGDIRFGLGGALVITEVGWDTGGCGGPNDGRPALRRLLEAVAIGRPGPEGTIVLSGPLGDVVLGR